MMDCVDSLEELLACSLAGIGAASDALEDCSAWRSVVWSMLCEVGVSARGAADAAVASERDELASTDVEALTSSVCFGLGLTSLASFPGLGLTDDFNPVGNSSGWRRSVEGVAEAADLRRSVESFSPFTAAERPEPDASRGAGECSLSFSNLSRDPDASLSGRLDVRLCALALRPRTPLLTSRLSRRGERDRSVWLSAVLSSFLTALSSW